MIGIDELVIRLPAGFGPRGVRIARLVAGELLRVRPERDARVESLEPHPVRVRPGASDREVARSVAVAIGGALGRVAR